MKLLVFTMFGQLLQQNMRVKRDFMAGGPVHVLTIKFAIYIIREGNKSHVTNKTKFDLLPFLDTNSLYFQNHSVLEESE